MAKYSTLIKFIFPDSKDECVIFSTTKRDAQHAWDILHAAGVQMNSPRPVEFMDTKAKMYLPLKEGKI